MASPARGASRDSRGQVLLLAPLTGERGETVTWPEVSQELGVRPRPFPRLPAFFFF